ncbi:MAG TPA: winged helix-turn-helix domain-containing protein [Actinomycetota bacterium]|nr:winged helix-turn-helix domain-containing protein [Actinomycetota bacterium]
MNRRPATVEEAKALANPLRLRILRLTLDQALTNKQLAERLDRDPGTVLHHVRTLVSTGFLVPEEVRQGDKGALEKPYRATGKSWTLSLDADQEVETSASQAMLDAFLAELAEAGPGAARDFTRLALTLDDTSLKELQDRLREVFDDFAARPPDPRGRPYGLLFGMHALAQPGSGAQSSEPSGSGGVDPRS